MRPLRTVHGLLAERAGLALLADPMLERATGEIVAGDRPRADVQRDIKQKERAREALVRRHRSAQLPEVRPSPCCAPEPETCSFSWLGKYALYQSVQGLILQ